ncbi:MAG: hypothetical protein R3270_01640 [Gammaproteobacteria bacterium]|nr:hypothetical protein [Gammaproteobacteria bacterium]
MREEILLTMSHVPQKITEFIPSSAEVAHASRLAAFKVSGADRETFLQGQLSNDVTALDDGSAQLTSYSNPKGRVFAIMRLARIGDDWWLLLDDSVADKVMQRLKMFVLRSDVKFDRDEDFASAVIVGSGAGNVELEAGLARLDMPGDMPRVEIFGARASLPAATADEKALRRWDTLSGLLQVDEAQTEQHVAQMLNLDRLGAIHFKKGCYAGQEIIARMHYLGKLKQRALPCAASAGSVGDTIIDGDGKKVGEILQSSDITDGRLHLAMLKLAAIDNELVLESGEAVTLLDTGLGHVGESTDAS